MEPKKNEPRKLGLISGHCKAKQAYSLTESWSESKNDSKGEADASK